MERLTSIRQSQDALLPLTVAEVVTHLRIDAPDANSDNEDLIKTYIKAARDRCIKLTGLQIVPATFVINLTCWNKDRVVFDKVPFREVTKVSYYDSDGDIQVLDKSFYGSKRIGEMTGCFWFKNHSELPGLFRMPGIHFPDSVIIEYKAGYENLENLSDLRLAMLHHVNESYDNRRDSIDDRTRLSETLMEAQAWQTI